jgi:single-strand DNA-binding protein
MYKTILLGHLGKDCVVNTVNGKSVCNFSVAQTEKYKDAQGTQHEKTRWFDCALWRDNTSIAQYLKKGTKVLLEGQIDVKQFQRQDGTQGVGMTFRVSNVELLGGGNKEPGQQTTDPINHAEVPIGGDDSGLPF